MSDDYPIKATFKGGQGYDAPWLTVDATDPADLLNKVQALAAGEALQAVVELANNFKAANNAAPLLAVQETPTNPAPQQQPWGQQPQQQAPQQAAPQQQGGGGGRGQQHPEGKTCSCGTVLEFKTTGNGKKKWQCPQWRWNNGNPNNHDVEWING